ncbi:filamentous hemagglutinin family protein [Verrucomicrobiota bacterium sgz303538]
MPKPESRRSSGADCPAIGASPSTALSIALSAVFGVLVTLGVNPAAEARDILRGGAGGGAEASQGAGRSNVNVPPVIQARAQAQDRLVRTTQALQAVQAMQKAARSAAAGVNNLGMDPNHPGQRLPNVPNGLGVGGLQVAPGVPVDLKNPQAGENAKLWQGAKLPKQTAANGQTTVTIKQTAPQAVLNWETFNIGKETTLRFDQNAGGANTSQWIAFNKINDPSGRPSQILGSIEAPGQVYVINRNGIIFGGSSQINLHGLVASALPINDNLLTRGLLNNPDSQFLFSGLAIPAGPNGTPAFTPDAPVTPDGQYGDVTVQPGAVISSPTTAEHVGGRVALIGANVSNAGTISTPDGQTILAAGLQVGFAAHSSSDPSLRGLDVYVGAVTAPPSGDPPTTPKTYAGTATNSGVIQAPRADVTITGKTVKQLGAINSSTSVSLNGRIDLLASYDAVSYPQSSGTGQSQDHAPFLLKSTGTVTLGDDSVTRILPELSSAESVVGTQLALPSQINIQGKAIHLASDAMMLAPNANVALSAGVWNFIDGTIPRSTFVFAGGQIYLDQGAMIDVSGSTGVTAPMSQNILSIELRGAELADSPLQRLGIFRGTTISIDIRQTGIYNGRVWIGTPLADASGYVGLIKRTVGELTTAGGKVTMNAGNSVVMQSGSVIDVSGGWIDYEGGVVKTTRVVSGGQLIDISQATPDIIHDGFYTGTSTKTYAKYGITETFTNPLLLDGAHYEPGYRYGANGGAISISAPSMALDGQLLGHTVSGPRQRTIGPTPSSLSLAFKAQEATPPQYPYFSPTPPDIIFSSGTTQAAVAPFALDESGNPVPLSSDRVAKVILSPDLLSTNGFGSLSIENSDGDVSLPAEITLATAPGGSITIKAANLNIQGHMIVPGGTISLSAYNLSPYSPLFQEQGAETPDADPSRGNFTLGATASLSTAGLVVDDRRTSSLPQGLPFFLNGGTITLSGYNTYLKEGSTIDASSGVAISGTGKQAFGNGGSISISGGQDPTVKSILGGELELGAKLTAYAGGKAGSLSIVTPQVQIGGTTDDPHTLLLSPDFFNQGGFGSFAINGIGTPTGAVGEFLPGLAIAPNTYINPTAESWVAQMTESGVTLLPVLKPEGLRTPVSIALGAVNVPDFFTATLIVRGDLVMGAGSVIKTDAGGSISLNGDTAAVLGSLIAPGGTISINGAKNSALLFPNLDASLTQALPTVHIGANSTVSTAGTTVYVPDGRGYRAGIVLPGGNITISGNIVAESGATLDVSGTSGVLDVAPGYSTVNTPGVLPGLSINGSFLGAQLVPLQIDSNGGSISLKGSQALFTDATLLGAAGGPTAMGGSLSISSGRFIPPGSSTPQTPTDVTLVVTQGGKTIPVPFYAPGETAIGRPVLGKDGTAISGQGHFAANSFNTGGFDSLSLGGTVQFSGPVTITAPRNLSVADGGVLFADSAVRLTAPHVTLGLAFEQPLQPEQIRSPFIVGNQPYYFSATHGEGSLTVTAEHIDVGSISMQNIGRVNLIADGGDIRGSGTLDVAGHIYMRAAQIYPPTALSFTVSASDYKVGEVSHSGSVTIASSGTLELPWSAGGELNIFASEINQGGVLRAPIGTINIGWDGSGTAPVNPISNQAFAASKNVTLLSGSVTSVSAVDPVTGQGLLIPYGLNLNGTSWIDPTGIDITAGGVPTKTVNISAAKIVNRPGSLVDLRGGGDLYSYRWVSGIGGTQDILSSTTSFAVIPGYLSNASPYAPFNPAPVTGNFGTDPGYVNSALRVGDRIYLGGSNGLPAGTYTLLPARYALLPGAFLVTPKSGAPVGTISLADGSSIVSGYRFNDLNGAPGGQMMTSRFEIASGNVVRLRAEYSDSFANRYLREGALEQELPVPRLPGDAGHLVFQATQAMTFKGSVAAQAPIGNRGGLVDISSSGDILIGGHGATAGTGTLVLNAAQLSSFGAESLLIGGIRQDTAKGTTVTVNTGNVTVDNAGTPLSGSDIILVAKEGLTLAPRAEISQSGTLAGGGDTLLIGNSTTAGSGNGTLLRVSSDPSARIIRSGLTASTDPAMVIGAGARITGASLTLDSTSATTLDPNASLLGQYISLNSGQISLLLDDPGSVLPTAGLVLSGPALERLQTANTLSLLSYSSIDLYGTGSMNASGTLALHAAEIRGFNNDGGTAKLVARNIVLDNSVNGTIAGAVAPMSGTLAFEAGTITLGANQLKVDQFANLELNASNGILLRGTGGLSTQGALTSTAGAIAAAKGANQTITAASALTINAPAGSAASSLSSGLGASVTLKGADVTVSSNILLPSGELTLHATTGDVLVGSRLDVSGTSQTFFDLNRYTNGGKISLVSDAGSVNVSAKGTITVSGHADGGNAGTVSISAPTGGFSLAGEVLGKAGTGGLGGTFILDAATVPGGHLASLDSTLNGGGFDYSRSIRMRTGDIVLDSAAKAWSYRLSADQGSITVTGTVDASGVHGGNINLLASGSVTLADGSRLTVAADKFSNAGKGGAVSLEAGMQVNGTIDTSALVDIQTGSTIDLSVASHNASSAAYGNFNGTLHLRAPQTSGSTDVQIAAINGSILNASSIVLEGYKVYDLTSTGGAITTAVQTNIRNDGNTFVGTAGSSSAGYNAMLDRLLANNAGLDVIVVPGAEIINRTGNLTLGTTNSTATSDWNLATFRFGAKNAAGVLTMRAAGDLVFYNALSDGFATSAYNSQLLPQNDLLPANAQSWSYRLTAGADFTAADFRGVQSTSSVGTNGGSLLLGKNAGSNIATTPGQDATTSSAVSGKFQVIRTGSGNIDIAASGDVKLLNQFATIYTAGTRINNPTELPTGEFDLPVLNASGSQITLGGIQQSPAYAVQYSLAGGNVTIAAQGNIAHETRNNAGVLIPDSTKELPMNWLYRRGYIDPTTGEFGAGRFGGIASTSWWVDFSNFFAGVGALGGGDVTMIAGKNISNVDASVPTNARMPKGTPDASKMVELGGGNLIVRAGQDIDGGVYYVERGQGTLSAGNSIHTNSTRSPSLGNINLPANVYAPETWLPTTLFVGKSSFDVSARGDVLLGPTANPFLLPESYNNTFWYKTYFSTYAPDSGVNVSSLSGNVTLRQSATLPAQGVGTATPLLLAWLENVLLLKPNSPTVSYYQPWLRLNETQVTPFTTVAGLNAPNLRATAFSGNLDIIGNLTLFPSERGTIELAAGGSLSGLGITGTVTINGVTTNAWAASRINLSDANPASVPGVASPFAYQTLVGTQLGLARVTGADFLSSIDVLFEETGSTVGSAAVLQTKQALHAPGPLHADDLDPVRLYADSGNISGLTLFSGKAARVVAGNDLTDIALYVQNVREEDVTLVAAGRDIVAYNANSSARVQARSPGNTLNLFEGPLAGDIQISGPGTLEVLAGRDLDLGVGPNNPDRTALGITSIGNARNPNLPFEGAQIIAGAGIGVAHGLADSQIDFAGFIDAYLDPQSSNEKATKYLPEIGKMLGLSSASQSQIWAKFQELPAEKQANLALNVFYLVLRDAGRDHGTTGNYDSGFEAIDTLFGGSKWQGDISLTSREIKTANGGDISLFAPGGGLVVGFDIGGNQPLDQGILTESGGNISIFTHDSVTVGTSRIFTLRGGDEIIWSSAGDIAAGASSKTVQSAPPTRVLIDPQTSDVKTDLAGLATGGGIGVLATVEGVDPGDVDLIAPGGTIDAGDAGIRVSGNLNISAVQVLNASNIQVSGTSGGVPATPVVAAPNLGSIASASSTAGATTNAAANVAPQGRDQQKQEELPSIITVDVVGYGGSDGEDGGTEAEDQRKKSGTQASVITPSGNAS